MATATEIQQQINKLQDNYRIAQNGLSKLNKNLQDNRAIIQRYTDEVSAIPGQIAALEAQLNSIQLTATTTAAQAAQDDAATGPSAQPVVTTASIGRINNTDTGIDAPVRTLQQTQATSNQNGFNVGIPLPDETGAVGTIRRNPETGELYDSAGLYPVTSPGVGSADDSKTIPTAAVGEKKLSNNSRKQIIPQPNVLDNLASYTYRASVYLMSPEEYTTFIRSKKKQINGYNLLFQSGGAPVNTGGFKGALNSKNQTSDQPTNGSSIPGNQDTDAGRNPAFSQDFYIDSITLKNIIQGRATGAAHGGTELKFTVIEPMNITLLDRIYEAVQDRAPEEGGVKGKINYQAAQFLMIIRWYGYDINGNPVQGVADLTDSKSLVEKYIPFVIRKIYWGVSGKLVNYEFDCSPVGMSIAVGTRRGTVPYDLQLSSGTVSGVLGNNVIYSSATAANNAPGAATTVAPYSNEGRSRATAAPATPIAPAKASAAPNTNKSVTAGLMGSLNDFNNALTTGKSPIYEQADEYEIVFAAGAEAIRDASIVLPGKQKEAKQTSTKAASTNSVGSASGSTDKKDTTSKVITVVAGQPIVQVIETVIRNSSYITDQALTIVDAITGKDTPNDRPTNKPVNWFNISFEAVPKPQQDKLRNDYAYKIRYIISAYQLDVYDSKYFPLGNFRGVHKSYPFWFTGKNTAVINYQETLDYAFTQLVTGSSPANSEATKFRNTQAATMREQTIYAYGPSSGASRQGSQSKGLEANSNLADSLFGGADLANTKLQIIGDPAWIQQGSIAGGVTAEEMDYNSFLPDGSINYDAEQVLFEVNYNRPEDYDLNTGLADPNQSKKQPVSRVYQATEVTSEFKGGKFEQTINGILFLSPKPDGSNKAPGAPMPGSQPAGDARATVGAGFATNGGGAAFGNPKITNQVNGRVFDGGGTGLRAGLDDSRLREKDAAGVGHSVTTALPIPAGTVTSTGAVVLNNAPPGPKDQLSPANPAKPPTSSTGNDLSAATLANGQVSRFRRNLETGELYDPGTGGIVNTTQDIARDY